MQTSDKQKSQGMVSQMGQKGLCWHCSVRQVWLRVGWRSKETRALSTELIWRGGILSWHLHGEAARCGAEHVPSALKQRLFLPQKRCWLRSLPLFLKWCSFVFQKSLQELLKPARALFQVSALLAERGSVLNADVNVHGLEAGMKTEPSIGAGEKALALSTHRLSATGFHPQNGTFKLKIWPYLRLKGYLNPFKISLVRVLKKKKRTTLCEILLASFAE